jgi:hypothetical protein
MNINLRLPTTFLTWFFVLLCVFRVFVYSEDVAINVLLMDVVLFFLSLYLYCLMYFSTEKFSSRANLEGFFTFFALMYLVVTYFLAHQRDASLLFSDYFVAYKSFYYLVVLYPFVAVRFISESTSVALVKFAVIAFLFKYAITSAGLLPVYDASRPYLLFENNFEILFLLILFSTMHNRLGAHSVRYILMLGLVVILSGSRSGAMGFFFVVVSFMWRSGVLKFRIQNIAAIIMGALFVYGLFYSRGVTNVEDIDRFHMFDVMRSEAADWGVWDYLFGSPAVTPLSDWACGKMVYLVRGGMVLVILWFSIRFS